MTPKCERCDDTFWVCEVHADVPWENGPSPRACKCGAPGMPCPECNACGGPDEPPRMPPGFVADEGGTRH